MNIGDIVGGFINAGGIPAIATVIVAFIQGRAMTKHAARQSILQLIMEDHMAVAEGRLPTNYQSILLEYDNYTKAGGNSYVSDKVSEYKAWWKEQEEKRKKSA